jgi:hypothetical protein
MSYIGAEPTTVAFLTDTFSGNGSTVAFTMSVAPATTTSILVAITGVVQDPSTYAVSGTTLTFSAAPPSGTGNISVRYMGIPASGVTTTAYRTVTEFTATAGQTTFSVPSYTVGYIDVYRNGSRLGTADFTATNGTTVVLAAAATAGDLVATESFYVSSVLNAIPATAGAVNSTYLAGSLTLTTPTLSSPVISGTPTGVGVLTSGTAVTASGTSIDFTGVPSWAKRITVMLSGVSTSGTANVVLQVGAGSITTSGYSGSNAVVLNAAGTVVNNNSTNFTLTNTASASDVNHGNFVLTLITSNTWVGSGVANNTNARANINSGSIALGGALDRVRITTSNGTDTFDAGSINILYE